MNKTLAFGIFCYAAAMIVANLTVAALGPWVTPINAFLLIGLDLALRDLLHVRLRPIQMLLLIVGTGAFTYVLNPAAGTIAVASSIAFSAAALVDWTVFSAVKGSWLKRSNASNVAGAAVDSLLFPTIAFGALLPDIVALQFAAKVIGGAVWSKLIDMARESRLGAQAKA